MTTNLLRCQRFVRPSLLAGLAVSVLASAPAAGADATLLVEFSEVLAGDGPGGTWNKFGTTGGVNGGTLVDAAGLATAVTLSRTGDFSASANAGTANAYDNTSAVGNPAWVASATNNLVAGDLFYTSNGTSATPHQTVLTFGGLTPGDKVSFDLLAARSTNVAAGFYEYSLDGTNYVGFAVLNPDGTPTTTNGWGTNTTQSQAFQNNADGYAAHRYMNVADVTLTGSTFRLRATDVDATSGNFASLNAMRLTVVPEPASAAALAAASIGLLAARRRRSTVR